jgi:hypothetical protein
MPDVKIKATVHNDKFKRKLNNLIRNMNKPLEKDLPLYTEWFVQSAVKGTPPKGKVKKKRTVIELKTNRFSKRGKELKRYKVPYRTNKKKGAKYFSKKKEANAFAKIKYRFIGKFGWLAAGENTLRKDIPVKMPKVGMEVKALKGILGKGRKIFGTNKPFILIINAVQRIKRYAYMTSLIALKTTQRRIAGSGNKKKVRKKYGKLWR